MVKPASNGFVNEEQESRLEKMPALPLSHFTCPDRALRLPGAFRRQALICMRGSHPSSPAFPLPVLNCFRGIGAADCLSCPYQSWCDRASYKWYTVFEQPKCCQGSRSVYSLSLYLACPFCFALSFQMTFPGVLPIAETSLPVWYRIVLVPK